MSFYENALRKVKKIRNNESMSLDAEMMYLAMARECDRTGKDRIQEDFELLGELITMEYAIHIREVSEKIYQFLSIPNPFSEMPEEQANCGILSYVKHTDSNLTKVLLDLRRELKLIKSSTKKAKEIRQKFLSGGFTLLQ